MRATKVSRLGAIIGGVAIGGWMLLGGVLLWWFIEPTPITKVDEPIPILNDGKTVYVGEPVEHLLIVDRPEGLNTNDASRSIRCESGNLITLTGFVVDLPPGKFEIVSDDLILPNKIVDGDRCKLVYQIEYTINPIRVEITEFTTEWFTVRDMR